MIHWPIVKGPQVINSIASGAISTTPTDEQRAIAVETVVVMAWLIMAVQEAEAEQEVAEETGHPIALKLAQAIDLAVQEIAALELAEIASEIAMLEVVLGIGAASETVPDSAAEMPAQVVAGELPAWAVRVGVAVELVVEVAPVERVVEVAPAELVVEVADVGGSLGGIQRNMF